MTKADSLAPVRLAAAMLALLAALTTLVADVVIVLNRGSGVAFGLTDVLVAPIVFVFYLGPALLLVGMASRSRTLRAAIMVVVLAVLLWLMLDGLRITPWHFRHWRGSASTAETNLVIGTLFYLWPGTAVGGLLWLALNHKPTSKPETE